MTPEQVETLKAWVKALRSGEYRQAKGYLKSNEGYCCLGVLAEVKGVSWSVHENILRKPCLFEGNGPHNIKSFVDWTGLAEDIENRLIDMNDHQNFSFAEIAAFIEGYIPLEARDQ